MLLELQEGCRVEDRRLCGHRDINPRPGVGHARCPLAATTGQDALLRPSLCPLRRAPWRGSLGLGSGVAAGWSSLPMLHQMLLGLWWSSQGVAMFATGQWRETHGDTIRRLYLGGATSNNHLLRHNVEEIHQWPQAQCHHIHDPNEWTPYTSGNTRVYPSKEEAEYTAVLSYAIAVAASWWAARTGKATLAVPRMPAFTSIARCLVESGHLA